MNQGTGVEVKLFIVYCRFLELLILHVVCVLPVKRNILKGQICIYKFPLRIIRFKLIVTIFFYFPGFIESIRVLALAYC